MSGSGIVTVIVLLFGTACCMFSYSANAPDQGGNGGIRSPGVTAPAVSAQDVRALHRLAAQKLHDQGLDEAASWHERMATGRGDGDVSNTFAVPVPAPSNDAYPAVSAVGEVAKF